jgi:hypothetical protein
MAGWAAGYAMSLIVTFALTYLAIQVRTSGIFDRFLDQEVPSAMFAVPISIGMLIIWTMIGLVIGSAYELGNLADQPAMLGSPSGPFTIAMVIIALLPLPPLMVLFRRWWWVWLSLSVSFAGLFGWVMPLLADR